MNAPLVLVVEPDALERATVLARVASRGHRGVGVSSLAEALGALERETPDVVVLSDLDERRPAESLAQLGLSRFPWTVPVAVSRHGSVRDSVEVMKLGASDFLVQPCAPDALDGALARALRLSSTRRHIAEPTPRPGSCALVGSSPAIRQAREVIAQLGEGSDATTVLVQGETGTGKEVVAQAIHARSARAARPYVTVNCAALPDGLVDGELFGHEKGAFTAAHAQRVGIFEAAQGGTVLLDEIGELPLAAQAKLLRLLENKTFRRLGAVEERAADVRVVAATHRDLEALVASGLFRADLFFRLNVIRLHLPPLRERPEDVAPLAACFVARLNERLGRSVREVSCEAMTRLEDHDWPGNARELRNVIERAFILYPGMDVLLPGHLPDSLRAGVAAGRPALPEDLPLPAAERWLLADAMRRSEGNQVRAARLLGISRPTLRYRLRKHGLGCLPRAIPA